MVDVCPHLDTALVGLVHLLPRADEDREVLQADAVVAVLATVRRPQPELRYADTQVDNLLATAVARIARSLREPERAEHATVELERALDVADRKIDVVQAGDRHGEDPTLKPPADPPIKPARPGFSRAARPVR